MRLILYGVLGIVAYLVLTRFWELLLEWAKPFEVKYIKSAQFGILFTDLYRRGFDGAEMVVAVEGGAPILTLRKELVGPHGIRLYLVLSGGDPTSKQGTAREAREVLRDVLSRHGDEGTLGIRGPWANAVGKLAYCGDSAEKAAALASDVLHRVYGLGDKTEYAVHVRGQIDMWDKLVTYSAKPSLRDIPMIARGTMPLGRPYKRSHLPQRYTLLGVVGLRPPVVWLKGMLTGRGAPEPSGGPETRDTGNER